MAIAIPDRDDCRVIDRRIFLKSVVAGGAALLASCAPTLDGNAVSATVERGTPFDTLRDYSAEPHPVRVINRAKFDPAFAATVVASPYAEAVGSVVINTQTRLLYLIEPRGLARRYGVAVGDAGYGWSGRARVGRKATWPAWHPTPSMHAQGELPVRVAPGAHNPLGARALYLFEGGRDTLYRIHGTSEPWTIGTQASSGCIRMFNEDVIDLYDRVNVGAAVIVT